MRRAPRPQFIRTSIIKDLLGRILRKASPTMETNVHSSGEGELFGISASRPTSRQVSIALLTQYQRRRLQQLLPPTG